MKPFNQQTTNQFLIMKRFVFFDILRSIAIVGVVLLHALYHEWTNTSNVESGSQEASPLVKILFYILTLAGLFYVVMGTLNSYMIYNRISTNENTPKQIFLSGLVMGIILITLHYVHRALTSADSGSLYYYIRNPAAGWTPAPIIWLINTCTLAMLGWTSIIVSGFLALLLRNEGFNKSKRNYWILGIVATLILIATPFVRVIFAPQVDNLIVQGNIFGAILLGAFVFNHFPLFPYTSYGLFGAIIGIALARNEPKKKILGFCGGMALIWITFGIIGLSFTGGLDPAAYDLNTALAIYNRTFMQYSQIGLLFLILIPGMLIFDFQSDHVITQYIKRLGWLRLFSLLSLTMFIFEPIVMVLIRNIIDAVPLFTGWHNSLGVVAIFGLINVILWYIIAVLWKKIGFKFSIEWIILEIARITSGKRSEKYDFKRLHTV